MSNDCFEQLNYNILEIGEKAPEFTAEAYEKGAMKKVSLSDYKGKWILLFFYPLDFTFVCPTEILELSAKVKEFEDLGVQVLTCSTDSTFSHQAWCKEIGDLNFPMLSDLTHDIADSYNVLNKDGVCLRGAFIIDDNGILQSMTVNNLAVGRSSDELLRTITAFQSGELCPIGWNKGDKTLGKA